MAKRKKNARVVCLDGREFWTTQKQFWQWVRDDVVQLESHRPLSGRFKVRPDRLIILIRHILLDIAAPNHRSEVLSSYNKIKRRRWA